MAIARGIVARCAECIERQIVVTHGTDTMVETARALADGVTDKTVVLTGAMIPYAFGSSDGLFNLGSALSFAQVLPPGIYIAMNGQCFLVGPRAEEHADRRLRVALVRRNAGIAISTARSRCDRSVLRAPSRSGDRAAAARARPGGAAEAVTADHDSREASAAGVASKMVCGASAAVPRSII